MHRCTGCTPKAIHGYSWPGLSTATPGACALQGAALPPAVRAWAVAAAASAPQPPAAAPLLSVHPSAWQAGSPGAGSPPEGWPPQMQLPRGVAGTRPDACAYRSVARASYQPCGGGAARLPVPGEPAAPGPTWGSLLVEAGPPAPPARPAHLFPASRQVAANGELLAQQQHMQHLALHSMQAFQAQQRSWDAAGCLQPQAASRQLSHAPLEWAALSQGAVQGFGQAMSRSGMPSGGFSVHGSEAEALRAPEQSGPQNAWASAPLYAFQLPGPDQDLGTLAQQELAEQPYPGGGYSPCTGGWAPVGLPLPSQGAPCQQALMELQGYGLGLLPPLPNAPQQQPHLELSCPDQDFGQAAGLLEAPHGDALQVLLARDGQALQGPLSWLAGAGGPKA